MSNRLNPAEYYLRLAIQLGLIHQSQAGQLFAAYQQTGGDFLTWAAQAGVFSTPQIQQLIRAAQLAQAGQSPHPTSPPVHSPNPGSAYTPASRSGSANGNSGSASRGSRGSGLTNSKTSRQGSRGSGGGSSGGGLLSVGDSLNGYTIVGELGRGGMGAVYKVQRGGAFFALKIMLVEEADKKSIQRFKREIELMSELKHPNIVQCKDHGVAGDRLYLIMELVEGGSLKDLVHDDSVDLRQRIDLVRQVADGMAFAHGEGVIHRDLKPANVMIDSAGNAKIADFGLASSLLQGNQRLTATGVQIGTPGYMAPEQVRGETKQLDFRCDIWALGIILYELLARERPFQGDSIPALYKSILEAEVPRLSEHCSEATGELQQVVEFALEKLAEERYTSAQKLADDLDQWLTTGEIRSQSQSAFSRRFRRLKRTMQRRRTLVLGVVVSIVVALTVLAAVVFNVGNAGDPNAKQKIGSSLKKLVKQYQPLIDQSDSADMDALIAQQFEFKKICSFNAKIDAQIKKSELSEEALSELTELPKWRALFRKSLFYLGSIYYNQGRHEDFNSLESDYLACIGDSDLTQSERVQFASVWADYKISGQQFALVIKTLKPLTDAPSPDNGPCLYKICKALIGVHDFAEAEKCLSLIRDKSNIEFQLLRLEVNVHLGRSKACVKAAVPLLASETLSLSDKFRVCEQLSHAPGLPRVLCLEFVNQLLSKETQTIEWDRLKLRTLILGHRFEDAIFYYRSNRNRFTNDVESEVCLFAAEYLNDPLNNAPTKREFAQSLLRKLPKSSPLAVLILKIMTVLDQSSEGNAWKQQYLEALQSQRSRDPARLALKVYELQQYLGEVLDGNAVRVSGTANDPILHGLEYYLDRRDYKNIDLNLANKFQLNRLVRSGQDELSDRLLLTSQNLGDLEPMLVKRSMDLFDRFLNHRDKKDLKAAGQYLQAAAQYNPWSALWAVELNRQCWFLFRNQLKFADHCRKQRDLATRLLPNSAIANSIQVIEKLPKLDKEKSAQRLTDLKRFKGNQPWIVYAKTQLAIQAEQFKEGATILESAGVGEETIVWQLLDQFVQCLDKIGDAAGVKLRKQQLDLCRHDGVGRLEAQLSNMEKMTEAENYEKASKLCDYGIRCFPYKKSLILRRALMRRSNKIKADLMGAFMDMSKAFLVEPTVLEDPNEDFRNSLSYTLSFAELWQLIQARKEVGPLSPDQAVAVVLFVYLEVINGKRKQSDLRETYRYFDSVMLKYSTNLTVLAIRAVYRALLRIDGANSDVDRCVAIRPDFGTPRFARVIILSRTASFSTAADFIREAKFTEEFTRIAKNFPELRELCQSAEWKKLK